MDQVRQWATYAKRYIPHPPRKTLTAWWIGINDTGDTLKNATVKLRLIDALYGVNKCSDYGLCGFLGAGDDILFQRRGECTKRKNHVTIQTYC